MGKTKIVVTAFVLEKIPASIFSTQKQASKNSRSLATAILRFFKRIHRPTPSPLNELRGLLLESAKIIEKHDQYKSKEIIS